MDRAGSDDFYKRNENFQIKCIKMNGYRGISFLCKWIILTLSFNRTILIPVFIQLYTASLLSSDITYVLNEIYEDWKFPGKNGTFSWIVRSLLIAS